MVDITKLKSMVIKYDAERANRRRITVSIVSDCPTWLSYMVMRLLQLPLVLLSPRSNNTVVIKTAQQ